MLYLRPTSFRPPHLLAYYTPLQIALRSHNNAERATATGRFKPEIVPVEVTIKKKKVAIDKDEHFRPGLTVDSIAKLPPAFIPVVGTVTAGNSSGINDGTLHFARSMCSLHRQLLTNCFRCRCVGADGC